MFNLGDRVKILNNDITTNDIETIDRIQYYNIGKVGTIVQISENECLINGEDISLSGRNCTIMLPIRLSGIEKV